MARENPFTKPGWAEKHSRFNRFRELATGYPCWDAPVDNKEALRAEIAQDTERHLQAGGAITAVPAGVTGLPTVEKPTRAFLLRDINSPDTSHYTLHLRS